MIKGDGFVYLKPTINASNECIYVLSNVCETIHWCTKIGGKLYYDG